MSDTQYRTLRIPESRAPENLIRARERKHGDAFACIICGLPAPAPKFYCHVIDGGGTALHAEDEALYVPDGGDMLFLPVGPECLKKHPEMKPFVVKA